MNKHLLLDALITSLTFALFSRPCAAGTVTVTYNNVYFQPSPGFTRIPAPANGVSENHTIFLFNSTFPSDANQDAVPLLGGQPTLTVGSDSYSLAYATVTGGVEGGATANLDPTTGQLPNSVKVDIGTANITVNYHYIPSGGPGCATCSSGAAYISEVDEKTGNPRYDYFVTVFVPPVTAESDPLTHNGNFLGVVDTTSAGVRIYADAKPLSVLANDQPGPAIDMPFDQWFSGPSGMIGRDAHQLDVSTGTTVYPVAFYRHYCPRNYHWAPTQTVRQCLPDDCNKDQVWNPATNKCWTPTCAIGQAFNPVDNQCGCREGISCPSPCEAICANGCAVADLNSPTVHLICAPLGLPHE
jgi:hypothetical protein